MEAIFLFDVGIDSFRKTSPNSINNDDVNVTPSSHDNNNARQVGLHAALFKSIEFMSKIMS